VKLLIRKGGAGTTSGEKNGNGRSHARSGQFYLERETLVLEAPKKAASVEYSATDDQAGVASASWTSTVLAGDAAARRFLRDRALEAGHEITGPVCSCSGPRARRGHGRFATIRNIDPDGKDVFEQGQQSKRCRSRRLAAGRRTARRTRAVEARRPYHTRTSSAEC